MNTNTMTRERMETKLAKLARELDALNMKAADLGQLLRFTQAGEQNWSLRQQLMKVENMYDRKMAQYRDLRNYLNS